MRKIEIQDFDHTQVLLECLRSSPLLVDDLPEAVCFDRGRFSDVSGVPDLNYAQKLGHLYEDALEYLLETSSEVNLLAKSLQVFNEERRTLGELDYLLEDKIRGEFIHLELAVKFYLIRYVDGEPTYPGPDPRDNWLNKLDRLRGHQLRLTESVEARRLLLEDYGVAELRSELLVYGKLFDHYLAVDRPCPPGMHPDCQRGSWRYVSEWVREANEEEITVIPKHLWPVDVEGVVADLATISREEFLVEAAQRCTMIWDEGAGETQFIAPNDWA